MRGMKIAFSTNAFVKRPLTQAIRTIGEIGYRGVEILADKQTQSLNFQEGATLR